MQSTHAIKGSKWKTKKSQLIKVAIPIITLIFILSCPNIIGIVSAASVTVFEDGFESNNLNSWDQIYTSNGGSVKIVSNTEYSGNFGAQFVANGYSGYQFVSVEKNISPKSELYARANIKVDINGINDSEDKLYLIRFTANRENVLFAGWKQSGSNIRWQLMIRDGSGYISSYSNSYVTTNQWYTIEAYWKKDSDTGKATLWINGNQEVSIEGQDTNNYGDVTRIQFGVAEAYQIDESIVYGDNFAISEQYIGLSETNNQATNESTQPNPVDSILLSDDFESNSLDKWTGTETSYRETVRTHSYRPYEGRYHARFSTSGSTGTENAYLYKNTDLQVAYAKGYFYAIRGFPLYYEDSTLFLISFVANGESVAGVGITVDYNEMKWTAYLKDRTTTIWPTYKENPTIKENEWYEIELYWQKNSDQGEVQVYVNGAQIFEISDINTNYYGNVDQIQMGIIDEYSVSQNMLIYGDNFEITTNTSPEQNEESSNQLPEPQPSPNPSETGVLNGLSGYPTSTYQIDQIIQTMDQNNLNVYRMSFNPEWFSRKPHPYRENYIHYFLDNCDYTIIVDRNHLYPPTNELAQEARNNWQIVKNSIYEVLNKWPNNQRVMVEIINEYISSDYYSRIQDLVTEIRSRGYTNPIVANKWSQSWQVINDPLDNTYQGYHFYFNSWSVSGAISHMELALSRGIKIINTEVGADFNGYRSFTTSTVNELNQFLVWCTDRGIGNTVWMNENLNNWPRYRELGLNFP